MLRVFSSTMEVVVGTSQVLVQLMDSGLLMVRGSGDIRNINMNSDNWG